MTDSKTPWSATANPAMGRRDERRLAGRVLLYWQVLKGDRALPAHSELPLDGDDARHGDGLWGNLFTVALKVPVADSVFVYTGAVMNDVCGYGAAGRKVGECLPPLVWEKFGYAFDAARLSMKPLTTSGRFMAAGARPALYRAIVLPLSEDGRSVDHLLGGFSFKYAEG